MKILHLVPTLDWKGGVETYLLTLFPLLEARGINVVTAYGNGKGELVRHALHVPTINDLRGFALGRGYSAVAKAVKMESPDVIHIHHINNLHCIRAAVYLRPTVITTHGYQFICPASDFIFDRTGEICKMNRCDLRCFAMGWLKGCLSRNPLHAIPLYLRAAWVLGHHKKLSCVISPSWYTAQRYVGAGFPSDRVEVIPYFCPTPPLREPRQEPAEPTISFLGRVAPYKGCFEFISALGLLKGVRGIIAGCTSPEMEMRLLRSAAHAGCIDRIEIRPWLSREAVANLMQETTVFIFPSKCPETLGIVGLEALASGVPVVASDVGGVREWLLDGITGLLVPPGDIQALATAVKRLLDSSHLRREMGFNGIELIREKFAPCSHINSLVAVYEKALERSW